MIVCVMLTKYIKNIDLVASKNVQVHGQNIVEYLDKAGSSTEGYKHDKIRT